MYGKKLKELLKMAKSKTPIKKAKFTKLTKIS